MYTKWDYIRRGMRAANNFARPSHKKLSTLMIYATDLCDSGCKHCLIWAKRPVKHLSLDKIIEVMSSKCVSSNTQVGLEGGEFMLHPQAHDVLKWFTQNHPNFDLLSNCLKPDSLIEAVKKYKMKRLYVSLDGDKETYKYMRGKDGYDSVIKVIEQCHKTLPISVMFTLSPYNSFGDLDHVVEVCEKYDVDIRVGVYNDIEFFDTVEKAHETDIGQAKNKDVLTFKKVKSDLLEKVEKKRAWLQRMQYQEIRFPLHDEKNLSRYTDFKKSIPQSITRTSENLDFLLLYDEWRRKHSKLKCYSILDSLVIHPNGNVPVCQNLGVMLGNVNEQPLDEIFNSKPSQKVQHKYVHDCNQCWLNFHRKYDIVMLRTLEKVFPKRLVEVFYGKYQWCFDQKLSYKQYMKRYVS